MKPIAYKCKDACYCADCGKHMHDNFIDVNAIYLYSAIPHDWCEVCLESIKFKEIFKEMDELGLSQTTNKVDNSIL